MHGSVYKGAILIQNGRAISRYRLGHKIGRLHISVLLKVQKKFENFLYTNTPLEDRSHARGTRDKSLRVKRPV